MAITACMVYVDLNPIRPGFAATPETSDFKSVKEQIEDRAVAAEAECSVASVQVLQKPPHPACRPPSPLRRGRRDIPKMLRTFALSTVRKPAGLLRLPWSHLERRFAKRRRFVEPATRTS